MSISRKSGGLGAKFKGFEGLTYPSREYLFECLQCSTLNYKVLSPHSNNNVLNITETPGLRSHKLVKNAQSNKIFKVDMINNLEGVIWTEKEMLVFCLSEKSDDDFEIASCGLGKQNGFSIEDSITSTRWEKTWFVNTVDGLLYQVGWESYHNMIEEYEQANLNKHASLDETMNLVSCATKHKIEPVNIHYMMNYLLDSQIGSFRLNKRENMLGFSAQ